MQGVSVRVKRLRFTEMDAGLGHVFPVGYLKLLKQDRYNGPSAVVHPELTMSQYTLMFADLVAILVLTFGLSFPRHRRRDLVVAFLGINVGVLAICSVLTSVDTSVGLGIGLFGVLSVIRLRSDELSQREVAYYFAALALGLLGGVKVTEPVFSLVMMGTVLVVMWVADAPWLLGRYRNRIMTLDRAFPDEDQAAAYVGQLLGVESLAVSIRKVDLVNDTTEVEVRFRTDPTAVPKAPVVGVFS